MANEAGLTEGGPAEGRIAPHVVVGVDGSDESVSALKWAADIHCVTNSACPVVVVREHP
jgi:hypothetical protein